MGTVYIIPENVMSKIQGFTDDYEKNENEFEGNDFKALLKEAVLLMTLVIEESSKARDHRRSSKKYVEAKDNGG